jgi:peptidoglycan/xylan/chitin deacetylase (PgdA/CDA1 family)
LRLLALLSSVPIALLPWTTSTAALARTDPGASPSAVVTARPEGPWPPASVLAIDPGRVNPPKTALAPSLTTGACPASSGVQRTAPGSGRTVALTFDDGPGASTAQILSILKRAGVPATFFNIGINQTQRPQVVRAEVADGFVLGNHTWSHPDMTTLSASEQGRQLDLTSAEQTALIGTAPCSYRPPYGAYDATSLAQASARHLAVWTWSVDTEDWKAPSATSAWVNRIVSLGTAVGGQQHPVVSLHNQPAGNPATVAALPRIINFYRSHGYRFVDLLGRSLPPNPFGDVTADGWSDVLALQPSTGTVWLYPRSGMPFSAPVRLSTGWSAGTATTRLGDVDGDGRDDVLARDPETGDLMLFRGSGTALGQGTRVGVQWNGMREITAVGALRGPGTFDLLAVQASTGDLYRYPWNGSALGAGIRIGNGWNQMDELTGVGDFNRDGHVDLLARRASTGDLFLYLGGSGYVGAAVLQVGNGWSGMRDLVGIGDYDRDGYLDVIAVEIPTGNLDLYTGHGTYFSGMTRIGIGWTGMAPLF